MKKRPGMAHLPKNNLEALSFWCKFVHSVASSVSDATLKPGCLLQCHWLPKTLQNVKFSF